ncbi:hypothetical protein MMC07_005327 [Pseudocyphellaria aurata]|nr:hypothetical protein [Pseudocyphellaria aurata]
MITFSPIETSFQCKDKDPDYSLNLEDPFNDLFNQYISHDSSSPSDAGNRSHEFEFLDFPPINDDTTSSESNVGDHAFNSVNSPKTSRAHRFPQALRYTQSQEVLPSQAYRRFPRLETPKAAISGAELLNLEGKRELPIRSFPASSAAATATPPLRRKTRFSSISPETLRHKNHKVSKSPGIGVSDPSKMMRSSYYYQHEMPSFNDCTQQLEQISLQTHGLPMPPLPSSMLLHGEKRGTDMGLNSGSPKNQSLQPEKCDEYRGELPEMAEFNPLPSSTTFPQPEKPIPQYSTVATGGLRETRSQTSIKHPRSQPPAEQPSSWEQATASTDSFEFTISPGDIHSDWPSNLLDSTGSYFENVGASQSAPALAHSGGDFCSQNLFMSGNPFDQFVNEDPSHDYLVSTTDPFQSTRESIYPPIVSPMVTTDRARTPSSRTSSPCPSASPTSKSPAKQRRRSKCNRRKGSAGALRPANTVGFVNFTPEDSQKILTGVAPSGSSKTKARREQEANEKERRRSQAAEKMFLESGVDLEKLRASGILFT